MSQVDPELRGSFRLIPTSVLSRRTLPLFRWLTPLALRRNRPNTDLLIRGEVPVPGSPKTMVTYRRVTSTAPVPVVIWIHGGGYVVGSNKSEQRWGAALCEAMDCAVIAAGYRLAPEFPFPAALDDLTAAVRWVRSHGADHGLDSERIIVGGESAGGGLAAALAQRLHDEGVALRGQLLVCPMLDDRTAVRSDIGRKEHLGWTNGSNFFGWSSYLDTVPGAATVPDYAVPARRKNLEGLPTAWIGVGDVDLFHEECLRYADRLRTAGVAVSVEVAEGAPHGFQAVAPRSTIARHFVSSAVDFVVETLSP